MERRGASEATQQDSRMRRKGSFSGLFSSAEGKATAVRPSMSLSQSQSPTPSPRCYDGRDTSLTTDSTTASKSEATTALDRAVASVLSPTGSSHIPLPRHESTAGTDTMLGYMVIHSKKPKRKKLFTLHRSYFVVADAARPVLEVFGNEACAERVYVFSLAGANVDFETDDVSHAVRAKCFCLNVQSWRKRGVDYLRPQGFIFYQENQAQMMHWVKCIHVAIRRANAASAKELVTRLSDASTVVADESSDAAERGDADTEHESENGATTETKTVPTVASVVVALPAPRSPRRMRGQTTRRRAAAVEPVASLASPSTTPTTSPTAKPPHVSRFNTMLATMKPHHSVSDSSETGVPAQNDSPSSRPKAFAPPSLMSSLHMPRGKSSSTRHVAGLASPPAATAKRLSDPFQCRKKDDTFFSGFPIGLFLPRGPRSTHTSTPPATTQPQREPTRTPSISTVAEEEESTPPTTPSLDESRLSPHVARVVFLLATCLGGVLQLSLFLPVAAAGVFVYVSDQPSDAFASGVVAACAVYVASSIQVSLGLCAIAAIVYGWSFADFRSVLWRRRRRLADQLLEHESSNFAHIQFPTWAVQPDVDRVVWLNKVLSTGWPFLKIAIRNSIMDNVNPLLETSRPAFMSSLSLVRVDLGTRVPVITGVKFVSANAKTDEITIDIDVRIMSDESLVAELRMVSSLGAAAIVSLRDLLLAGTLRLTLTPLATYWPCFGGLRLCFTERPLVDFSLTAAKINLSNVPFASEWLQTFLHDLLLDYFVWPKTLDILLWDETGAPAATAT